MKKIAVLIPAFNAANTISVAVESMLWQEIPEGHHYEVIVLDDGSTDATVKILEELAGRQRRNRLRVLSNDKNSGIVVSLNRLIEAGDADYYVRMDADDISLPGRILAQIEALDAGQDLIGTFAYSFGSRHGERQFSVDRMSHVVLSIVDQRSFCHPTIAFTRRVAQIGYKDQAAEDYQLLTDVLVAGLNLTNIPRPYLMYRVHDESLSSIVNSARFARLRKSVCAIRADYISRLLGVDTATANSYSDTIERKIFRRSTQADLAALDRLGATFQARLGAKVDFKGI